MSGTQNQDDPEQEESESSTRPHNRWLRAVNAPCDETSIRLQSESEENVNNATRPHNGWLRSVNPSRDETASIRLQSESEENVNNATRPHNRWLHSVNPSRDKTASIRLQSESEENVNNATRPHNRWLCAVNPSYEETPAIHLQSESQEDLNNFKAREGWLRLIPCIRIQSQSKQNLHNTSATSTQSCQVVGYCFDVAIGLANILGIVATSAEERVTQARAKLVELALAQSLNKEFRDLLAPEIRHVAALTVESMNYGIKGSETNMLPLEMCTEDLQVVVNRFLNVHNDERVRNAVTECNDALGRSEGARLHWDDLREFFQNPVNCNTYSDACTLFNEVWKNVVEPANIAFAEYCSQETTYRQYIENYYGKGGWFAFQREFNTECSTSMVDVTAKLLELTIIIYDIHHEIYYRTECYGHNEISIIYNGVDHFTILNELPDPTE